MKSGKSDTISEYIASNDRVINKQQTGKDVEGNGHGLILGTITGFAWGTGGKPQKLKWR